MTDTKYRYKQKINRCKVILTTMFKSLHGCTPSYLSDACKSAPEASRRLRSSGAIMRHTVVQNSSGRQVVWCRRTAALEQAACFTAVVWQSLPIQKRVTLTGAGPESQLTVEKTVENVFVCQGLFCGALSLLLLGAGYKYSYLLTYLFPGKPRHIKSRIRRV